MLGAIGTKLRLDQDIDDAKPYLEKEVKQILNKLEDLK
jgi:hypothetical protein